MQKIDDGAFSAMGSSANQKDWLEVAEYASIAGSAIGTVATALSGQFIYAAAPLTAALSLNFANRQRFQEQLQHKTNSSVAGVHLTVKSLQQQVEALPEEPAQLYTTVSDLQQKLRSLESAESVGTRSSVESVQQQVQSLPEDTGEFYTMLSQLQQKLYNLENTALKEQDWENVNVRFLLIDEKLAEVQNITAELQDRSNETDLGEIQASLQQMRQLLDRPTIDVAGLQTEVQHLQQQVAELQRQNREIVKPYLQRLTRAMKQLSAK
ncbi:MAG: hypothetical protein ACRC62_00390 [Microcoleus sp.]